MSHSDFLSTVIDSRMLPKSKHLYQTPAQRLSDVEFLKGVEAEFVNPLVSELSAVLDGFLELEPLEREIWMVKLNEHLFGQGDCLPLGPMLVYAGIRLGQEETYTVSCLDEEGRPIGEVSVVQYHPRFTYGEPFIFRGDLETPDMKSDLELFLAEERATYDTLPPAYKAALLYMYIDTKVIAKPEDIRTFIMGGYLDSPETMRTRRFSVTPSQGHTGLYNGWDIRLRDAKPSTAYGKELNMYIRQYGDLIYGRYENELAEPGSNVPKQRKDRTPNQKTELACKYAYSLEQKGVILDGRKKGGISFTKVVADMKAEYGDAVHDYPNPDNFRKTYADWKKRHHLS